MYQRCFCKEAGRRRKKKKTKGNNTQTKVRQMCPATRGLQLFIMKGIHCSVPALPLSTQFFHTGPPSLLFAPSLVFVPLFFLLSSTFFLSVQFGVKQNLVCRQERARGRDKNWIVRGRERQREQICRTAWRPAWGHACHFSFHPSRLLAGAYAHKSAYCTWASAELRWAGGGGWEAP